MPLISHAEVRELPPPEVRRAASVSVFFGGPGSGFVRTPNLEVTRVIAASGDCNPCNANLALFVITPAQNRSANRESARVIAASGDCNRVNATYDRYWRLRAGDNTGT